MVMVMVMAMDCSVIVAYINKDDTLSNIHDFEQRSHDGEFVIVAGTRDLEMLNMRQ